MGKSYKITEAGLDFLDILEDGSSPDALSNLGSTTGAIAMVDVVSFLEDKDSVSYQELGHALKLMREDLDEALANALGSDLIMEVES